MVSVYLLHLKPSNLTWCTLAKTNSTAMTATPHDMDDSISETSMDEDIVDIPSPAPADHVTDDDAAGVSMSEDPGAKFGTLGSGSLPALVFPNDAVGIEPPEPNTTTISTLERASPRRPLAAVQDVRSDVDRPQQLNLSDEQVAFAIVSALAAVPTPSTIPVAVQGVPPSKAQRKLGANGDPKLDVTSAVVASTSTGHKRKRQAKLPPVAAGAKPPKKMKTSEEPQKRVSAR